MFDIESQRSLMQEISLITHVRRLDKTCPDRLDFLIAMHTEISALYRVFDPQLIDKALEGMNSNKYLVAVPITQTTKLLGESVMSVRPQDKWSSFNYWVNVTVQPDYESFVTYLRRDHSNPARNFQNLGGAGLLIRRPERLEGDVVEAIARQYDPELVAKVRSIRES